VLNILGPRSIQTILLTESLSRAVFEILGSERIGITHLTFQEVAWRNRSCDHSIRHRPFPIVGPLEPSLYLWRFPRYSMANVRQWLTYVTLNDL